MLPLSEAGKKFSGSLADGESHGVAEPGKDLQTQLGHKKNTVAYEITLGTVLSF